MAKRQNATTRLVAARREMDKARTSGDRAAFNRAANVMDRVAANAKASGERCDMSLPRWPLAHRKLGLDQRPLGLDRGQVGRRGLGAGAHAARLAASRRSAAVM
jgi:hypothetical protein